MTAIVAVADEDRVYMGGDSCVSWAGAHDIVSQTKIAHIGNFLIGVCGDVRSLNIILGHFKPPAQKPGLGDLDYICGPVVDKLRVTLHKAGCLRNNDGSHRWTGELVLGYKGRVYSVDGIFGVTTSASNEMAAGSGSEICRGVLFGTRGHTDTRARIEMALTGASELAYGVRPPFKIIECSKPTVSTPNTKAKTVRKTAYKTASKTRKK